MEGSKAHAAPDSNTRESAQLDLIRQEIVNVYGGMGPGSSIWSGGQWEKGYVAGITSALTAFDAARAAITKAVGQ